LKVSAAKKIFILVFQSGIEKVLLNKIIKICDLFNVSRYVLPKPEEMQYQINILRNEIIEKEKFLDEMDKSLVTFFEYRIGDVCIDIFLFS
jgi:hypothetical protein